MKMSKNEIIQCTIRINGRRNYFQRDQFQPVPKSTTGYTLHPNIFAIDDSKSERVSLGVENKYRQCGNSSRLAPT